MLGKLIEEVDQDYHCFEGTVFKQNLFVDYLIRNELDWPRTQTGRLDLSDSTFKNKALEFPQLETLRELRSTLSQTRNLTLTVGRDGRNRCMQSPFASKTGRNQPSNAKWVFGPSKWVRFLIKPEEGMALAYVDVSQQEFGIAGALSGDKRCRKPMAPSIHIWHLPSKLVLFLTMPQRNLINLSERCLKRALLEFYMGFLQKAWRTSLNPPSEAGRQLLAHHKACYPDFWQWSQDSVSSALLRQEMVTRMGWHLAVPPRVDNENGPNTRSLSNFPMQSNASEILRVAVIMAEEAGIRVIGTIHDAMLIEAPIEDIEDDVWSTCKIWGDASEFILQNFRLKSTSDLVVHPERFYDERGQRMWDTIVRLLDEVE